MPGSKPSGGRQNHGPCLGRSLQFWSQWGTLYFVDQSRSSGTAQKSRLRLAGGLKGHDMVGSGLL